ncbi:hypothetical protein BDR03DRAFT_957971 [Suillus americanus]|nr:hypothetical protein BDR03DRAFT_957971 [Suillus americanus]
MEWPSPSRYLEHHRKFTAFSGGAVHCRTLIYDVLVRVDFDININVEANTHQNITSSTGF